MPDHPSKDCNILILGVGNSLLTDDGFGVHVAQKLCDAYKSDHEITVRDGGTIGLALLPDIEDASGLIVIDAGELNESPGTMKVFFGDEMDAHLSAKRGTVHELAMSDVLQAAALTGKKPSRRALVVVQPSVVTWGEFPSESVSASIFDACALVADVVEEWRQ